MSRTYLKFCMLAPGWFLLVGIPCIVAQPRAEVLLRVVPIKVENSTATTFFIEVDDRQYLVTANHVVTSLKADGNVQLRRPDTLAWTDVRIRSVMKCGSADIAVLAPAAFVQPELKRFPVLLGSEGLQLGGEVYFLGFPYDFDTQSQVKGGRFLVPFVKHAIVSAMVTENGSQVIYLDGYNNPGFSGGPVVVFDQTRNSSRIVGVVSAYRNEPRPVRLGTSTTPLPVDSNAGIIVTYDLAPAVSLIRANPVGPRLE